MNDAHIKTLTQNLTNAFLPAMTASSITQPGFSITVREIEDSCSEDAVITTTVNINRDLMPMDGFLPTQAEVVFEIDFACQYDSKNNTYVGYVGDYCLNYGHYSHNLLWATGSVCEGEVPFDSSDDHGITDEQDKLICYDVVDALFGLTDKDTLKPFLQAVFEIASKEAIKGGWCVTDTSE